MKNKKLIKTLIIGVLLISVVLILTDKDNKDDNSLRIRVIANSDSLEDQNYKQEIVRIVNKYIKANDSKNQVKTKLPSLNKALSDYSHGEVQAEIKKTKFPPKTINGVIIAGGNYDTLLIKIGKAQGKNYWTLLYPEYFKITFEEINSGDVEVKWFLYELFN